MSFQKTTTSLAKELDPQGGLIPVCSSIDQENYQPFCLLYKKIKTSWWKTEPFNKTEYKLTDVVCSDGDAVQLDVKDGSNFTIKVEVDGTVGAQISGPGIADIEANVSMSCARSLKVKKLQLCPTIINSVKKLKIDRDHEFIKQSKKLNYDLYIVTEAVETVEDAQIEESSQTKGAIFYQKYLKMGLKGSRDSKKTILIPKSCILAFRTKKLKVLKESLGLSYYSDDNIGTWYFAESEEEYPILSCPTAEPSKESIQWEVDVECAQFTSLSANLRGVFLTGFVALMKDKDLLQNLEFQLEEALEAPGQCELKAEEPELQDLMENLQDCCGVIISELAKAIVYFLKALDELQEEQLMLLEESVEKRIVPKQLALVEILLDHIRGNREVKFTVDAQILSKEEMLITGAMIEMSGVTIQETEAHLTGTGEPAAFVPFYVVLYVLNLLTKQEDD